VVDKVGKLNMAGAVLCGLAPLVYVVLRSLKWKRRRREEKGRGSLKRSHSMHGNWESLSNSSVSGV
jgi:hypothetical protein